MKHFMALCVLLVALPGTGNAQETEFSDTNFRQWTDSSDQNGMKAKLVSHDPETGMVYLEDEDQTRIEIPLNDLSISDRRYLTRQNSRAKRQAKREQHLNGSRTSSARTTSVPANLDVSRSARRTADTDDAKRLYGIDWNRSPETASQLASGKEGSADDKPVIWFRVLGELDGYM